MRTPLDRSSAARLTAFGLCLALLCSCATSGRRKVEPWLKDGRAVGTIHQVARPWGFEYQYRDAAGRLVRAEKRDQGRQFLSGACVTEFEYDPTGRKTEERYLDASENPCVTGDGYALHRWTYSWDRDANRLVEESFFGPDRTPVVTKNGYAVLRRKEGSDGRMIRIEFLDASLKPAPSTWLRVPNVVEVQYSYLQGVGEVTCAAFLDASGNVVARKQLGGRVSESWSSSFTTYTRY